MSLTLLETPKTGFLATRPIKDDVWIWIDLCLSFLIPCVLIFTGNILILVQLARRARQHKDLGDAQQKITSLTLLLHLLSIVFLVSTAPYNILIMILNYLDENAADPSEVYDRYFYYQDILTVVVALNPTLNSMLYFLSGSKFRKEVKALVCCETTRDEPSGRAKLWQKVAKLRRNPSPTVKRKTNV